MQRTWGLVLKNRHKTSTVESQVWKFRWHRTTQQAKSVAAVKVHLNSRDDITTTITAAAFESLLPLPLSTINHHKNTRLAASELFISFWLVHAAALALTVYWRSLFGKHPTVSALDATANNYNYCKTSALDPTANNYNYCKTHCSLIIFVRQVSISLCMRSSPLSCISRPTCCICKWTTATAQLFNVLIFRILLST